MSDFPSGPEKNSHERIRRTQRSHLAGDAVTSPQQQYLSFRLDDEWYALSVRHVVEILPPPKITRVPGSPDHVLGVINLRGEVVPAINLKILIGTDRLSLTADPAIIVVGQGEVLMGLLVDCIGDLASLPQDEFGEGPVLARTSQPIFLDGAAHWGELPGSIVRLEGLLHAVSPHIS